MMGEGKGQQDRFFYEFSLEDCVPADHLLRKIDRVLGRELASFSDIALLQPHRPPLGLPRADDPDAVGRLLLFDPFGTAALPRG